MEMRLERNPFQVLHGSLHETSLASRCSDTEYGTAAEARLDRHERFRRVIGGGNVERLNRGNGSRGVNTGSRTRFSMQSPRMRGGEIAVQNWSQPVEPSVSDKGFLVVGDWGRVDREEGHSTEARLADVPHVVQQGTATTT